MDTCLVYVCMCACLFLPSVLTTCTHTHKQNVAAHPCRLVAATFARMVHTHTFTHTFTHTHTHSCTHCPLLLHTHAGWLHLSAHGTHTHTHIHTHIHTHTTHYCCTPISRLAAPLCACTNTGMSPKNGSFPEKKPVASSHIWQQAGARVYAYR